MLSVVILISPSALTLIVTRNCVNRNTRWCGEAALSGTDGNSYQEGSWSAPGRDGMQLAVINTVRSDRSPPGCTLQSDEFWRRAWSDNTTLVTCWYLILSRQQHRAKETAVWKRPTRLHNFLELVRWDVGKKLIFLELLLTCLAGVKTT